MADSSPSQDQPQQDHSSKTQPTPSTNGHHADTEAAPGDIPADSRARPPTSDWQDLEKAQTELNQKTEKAHWRKLDATARLAEAKARTAEHQAKEAGHRAAAEPKRQKMALRERVTQMWLEIAKFCLVAVVTLALLGIQIAGMLVDPLIFSLNLVIAGLGFLTKYLLESAKQEPAPQERGGPP